jgi:hypothetical protein
MNEIAMKLRLSDEAKEKLARRAADTGRDLADYASQVIEQDARTPTLEEVLAPIQADFARSGMTEAEFLNFGRSLLDQVRAERHG